MAATPESKVKDKVKKILKKWGAYYAMPIGTGFGHAGVPDFLVCFEGKFIGIECKANGGKLTALQRSNLLEIAKARGFFMVINETNVQDLDGFLAKLDSTGTALSFGVDE